MVQARPEPSYSRTYLTRRNYNRPSLLRKFRNNTEKDMSKAKSLAPEPGTDDDPVSSSDEGGSDNISSPDAEETGAEMNPGGKRKTLAEKLASNNDDNGNKSDTKKRRSPRSRKDPSSSRRKHDKTKKAMKTEAQKSPKRTFMSTVDADSDNDNEWFFSSSQNTKRSRSFYHGSQSGGRRALRSSATSSIKAKTVKKEPAIKEEEEKEKDTRGDGDDDGSDRGFKVPRSIDLGSPSPKVRKSRTNEARSNSSHDSLTARDNAQLFDIGVDESSLSSPLSSTSQFNLESLELTEEEKALAAQIESSDSESLCPMCKQKVDPDLLGQFMLQPKRRLREQQRFCNSHKQDSDRQEWKNRGYPTINWKSFDKRISRHFRDLEKVLVPDSSSYYRSILDESMKTGKARFFRLSLIGDGLETISCGYYGSRGASKMYFNPSSPYAPCAQG